jgi:hypothetical protein
MDENVRLGPLCIACRYTSFDDVGNVHRRVSCLPATGEGRDDDDRRAIAGSRRRHSLSSNTRPLTSCAGRGDSRDEVRLAWLAGLPARVPRPTMAGTLRRVVRRCAGMYRCRADWCLCRGLVRPHARTLQPMHASAQPIRTGVAIGRLRQQTDLLYQLTAASRLTHRPCAG